MYASSAATWYSDYQEDIDLDKTPDQLIAEHDAAGTITLNNWDRRRKSVYFTTTFGAEMELNRFLLGASADITLGAVDGVLLKNYYNINVSLGYMLFTKNKLNRKIHREE